MKRIIGTIATIIAVALLLCSCHGGGSSSHSSSTTAAQAAPKLTPMPTLQESYDESDNHVVLTCPVGQEALDLPPGKTVQSNGESLSLTQTLEATNYYPKPSGQKSVTLKIVLDSRDAVKYVIVHSTDATESPVTGGADDRSLSVQIGPNGRGQYLLDSDTYGRNPGDGYGEITSVTVCVDQSAADHTPAPNPSSSS